MPAPCLFFSCRPCPALLLSCPPPPHFASSTGLSGVGVARLRCSSPSHSPAARSLSFRHWPASGGAFELLSASPACMSSSVLLWRPEERRARQRLVCWAPMPPPRPCRGEGEAGGARGISGSSLCRPPHAPGGAGAGAGQRPCPRVPPPCSCVRAERSPGRPPPRALYFPRWIQRKVCQAEPANLR